MSEIEPDNRHVIVVVDFEGNKGKSVFCKWAFVKYKALYGKASNASATSFLYNGQRICLFDVERADASNIDWSLIEAIKNGILINTKYEVAVKTARSESGTSHVFIFMNEYPDFLQLSHDRWHVIDDLSDELTIHQLFPAEKFPGVADLRDPFDEDWIRDNLLPDIDPPPPQRRRRMALRPGAPRLQIRHN